MKIFSLLSILVLFVTASFSQTTLKGKIIDATTKSPLADAAIFASGKTVATTDRNGSFSINCNAVKQISISFVGYATLKVDVKNCNDELNIELVSSSDNLSDVEITATSNQNKSLLYQPVSITKLGETELKRGNGLFLDDAINGNVPGVTMNRRAVSSGQQFNIRGYGNGARGTKGVSSNFDGQGYKVYLNGIPVTDAEGITVMDDLDFGSIGNVEITKGPSGTLYGLAIAGAVNLKTIKPEKGKTSVGQDILIGNYGLQRYTTHFETASEHSSILLNYGHQKSDGFTIHNASKKDFVNFIGEFQPNAKQTVSTYFGYSNSYDERSGELTIDQYNNFDYTGNIEYIKRNGHSQVYTARAGVSHVYNFTNNLANTTTVFGTAFNSNATSAGGWTDKAATNFGLRSTLDTKFNLKNGNTISGITGIETQRQNASTLSYSMIKDPNDPNAVWSFGNPLYWIIGGVSGSNTSNGNTSNVYSTTANTSLFTEWTLALPKDFSVTAGIGYSTMKIGLDDRFFNPSTPNKTRRYDTSY
ncbi:MAG: TonB-dependent receptor plug domain-containing protein, partial [Chitinophagaceae bacterium]|nr:TonB-dependent receptor plug domain-containing protein [Chitinophagaceae bacterium]